MTTFVPDVSPDNEFIAPDGKKFNTIHGCADYIGEDIDTPVQVCNYCHTIDVSGDQQPFEAEHGIGFCTDKCWCPPCSELQMTLSNPRAARLWMNVFCDSCAALGCDQLHSDQCAKGGAV